jgi:hypothetical protein
MKNFDGPGCRIHLTIRQLRTRAITFVQKSTRLLSAKADRMPLLRELFWSPLAARLCVRAAAWRRCFIANYWLGYYLCMYPFPGRSLYCCGRAVDGVMMALSEYKWSIKHAQRENKSTVCVLDSQGVEH